MDSLADFLVGDKIFTVFELHLMEIPNFSSRYAARNQHITLMFQKTTLVSIPLDEI